MKTLLAIGLLLFQSANNRVFNSKPTLLPPREARSTRFNPLIIASSIQRARESLPQIEGMPCFNPLIIASSIQSRARAEGAGIVLAGFNPLIIASSIQRQVRTSSLAVWLLFQSANNRVFNSKKISITMEELKEFVFQSANNRVFNSKPKTPML